MSKVNKHRYAVGSIVLLKGYDMPIEITELLPELEYKGYDITELKTSNNKYRFPQSDIVGVIYSVYPTPAQSGKRKEPKELIRSMLDSGWKYVPCRVYNEMDTFVSVDLITGIFITRKYSFVGLKNWEYAVPFDPRTDRNIVDYVNGEVILED